MKNNDDDVELDPEGFSEGEDNSESEPEENAFTRKPLIGAKENQRVLYVRVLVVLVLVACATMTGVLTYVLTSLEETNRFERDVSFR